MVHNLSDKEFRASFEMLFKQYFKRLCFYAMSFLKDEEMAKDIIHDVFIGLWNNRSSVDFGQPMLPYLLNLVRNRCFNSLEHRKVCEKYARYQLTGENAHSVAYDSDYDMLIESVIGRIDRLPAVCREVMRLCFLEGKKYKEVADLLGISVNTVKTHISSGLRAVRTDFPDSLITLFFQLSKKCDF